MMGSKRSSSKNPKNARSSPPSADRPADSPADANHQNPKNSTTGTPSKSRKKLKVSAPISTDSGFLSLPHSIDGEANSQNSNRKGDKAPEVSNEISHSDGAVSRPSLQRWAEADVLKLLKALVDLQEKGELLITPSNIEVLLKEIKDWAPCQLSEKNLWNKLRHLRFKFQKKPKPGTESSPFDRKFYELASKLWGSESLKAKGSATGGMKVVKRKGNAASEREKVSKKPKGGNKKVDVEKEDEDVVKEEERDSKNDQSTKDKVEKSMELENGEEHKKDKLLVDGDNGLLDVNGAGHSYIYLRHALEEYWTKAKLNMDTLYAALPKVNPVQAKRLDEDFRELFVGMLKLQMEKNKVSNKIIRASLGC